MPVYNAWTAKESKELERLLSKGFSRRKIAKIMGRALNTVQFWALALEQGTAVAPRTNTRNAAIKARIEREKRQEDVSARRARALDIGFE